MKRNFATIAILLMFAVDHARGQTSTVFPGVGFPVEHPVVSFQNVRTPHFWRQSIERFGESLASNSLKLRGYEVVDLKLPGNHGIDLYALKRDVSGMLTDVRLVEVKTHYGKGLPRLGTTRAGTQMSRMWLTDRLRRLRSGGNEGKRLALEISHFRKASGVAFEQLGEVHDFNLRFQKYTIRNPITMIERAGPVDIERLLKNIVSQSEDPATKAWALRHVEQFPKIREMRMAHWVDGSISASALDKVASVRMALLEEKQTVRGIRGLGRTVGRIAFWVAVAIDAHEIYGHVRDYRLGKISQREFSISLARSGGGITGAWAGASGGASVGAWIGAFGGPFAWVTEPAGIFIGGAVGGMAGYFGGSYLGESAAQAWYGSLDKQVKAGVSQWVKAMPTPLAG